MVIRHHLAHEAQQLHKPVNNNAVNDQGNPSTSSNSATTSNTKSISSSSPSTTATTGSTKPSPPPTTSPAQKNGATDTKNNPTTSPSSLSNGKTQASPLPPPSVASKSNSTTSSPTKAGALPVSSSTDSTKPSAPANKTLVGSSSSNKTSTPIYSNGKFLGIQASFLIHLALVVGIIAIIVTIIVIIYRRYQTRKDYNDSPENFAHKPVHSFNEEYYLNHSKIQKCISPEKITIEEQNPINGKLYKVEFKGTEKSAVFFHRRQETTCYFEIQVLQSNGSVQIGFIPFSNFAKMKTGEQNMGSTGVGVTNSGFVQAQGENIYNYSWILAYGDVFGIGLTRENSKFSERRAWISKNGVLLNQPPNDEMDKWLATIEISAEEKNEYNLGTDKKENEEQDEEKQDEQKLKQKAQKQKIEGLLKKQRISLKTFNKFEYYPVIVCHGNKDDSKSTIINVNVGGQIFRMYDAQFRSGLLKHKGLFSDD